MRRWLGRQRSWLVVEPLPGYAPDLNPVEGLWDARIDGLWDARIDRLLRKALYRRAGLPALDFIGWAGGATTGAAVAGCWGWRVLIGSARRWRWSPWIASALLIGMHRSRVRVVGHTVEGAT